MSDKQETTTPRLYPDAAPLYKLVGEHVDEQIERLIAAANVSEASAAKGVAKEAAILSALSARESTAGLMTVAGAAISQLQILSARLELGTETVARSADQLNANLKTLSTQVETFTTKADEGTGRLVWATWALAGATFLLVCATVALVVFTARLK